MSIADCPADGRPMPFDRATSGADLGVGNTLRDRRRLTPFFALSFGISWGLLALLLAGTALAVALAVLPAVLRASTGAGRARSGCIRTGSP